MALPAFRELPGRVFALFVSLSEVGAGLGILYLIISLEPICKYNEPYCFRNTGGTGGVSEAIIGGFSGSCGYLSVH